MQENFKKLSTQLFKNLNNKETLMLSLSAEKSHFCRLNQSKVRQIGEVQDVRLSLSIINSSRICHGSITLMNNFETDLKKAIHELNRIKEDQDREVENFIDFSSSGFKLKLSGSPLPGA